jgi:hypothetical protein
MEGMGLVSNCPDGYVFWSAWLKVNSVHVQAIEDVNTTVKAQPTAIILS